MSEKRVDPEDGSAYTWEELRAFYKGKYKANEVDAYWETCKVLKTKGKGKSSKGDVGSNHAGVGPERPETRCCYNCDEVGHISRDCPKPKREHPARAVASAAAKPCARGFTEAEKAIGWRLSGGRLCCAPKTAESQWLQVLWA